MTLRALPALNHSSCSGLNVWVQVNSTWLPSGLVQQQRTGFVGGQRGEIEDGDAVVLADRVVAGRIGEGERQQALLLQIGLMDPGEGPGQYRQPPAVSGLHRRVLSR